MIGHRSSIIAVAIGFVLANPMVNAMAGVGLISLDYCADQYAIALAERSDIKFVSPAATTDYSYMAERAKGLPQLRPTAEEVVLADPGLVIRQWGGGYNAGSFLEKVGVPIVQVAFTMDYSGAVKNLDHIGTALNASGKGQELIQDTRSRLNQLAISRPERDQWPLGLYVTPAGVTTGSATFVHDMLEAAGVRNMAAESGRNGWHPINLEALALEKPDLIVGAFFDLASNHVNNWSLARHSFLRELLAESQVVMIPGRLVACSAWFYVDAVELIFNAAHGPADATTNKVGR